MAPAFVSKLKGGGAGGGGAGGGGVYLVNGNVIFCPTQTCFAMNIFSTVHNIGLF